MNRRQFFKNSILGGMGLAIAGVFETSKAWAAELIKMNADGSSKHAQAKGLGYVADLEKALADSKIAKAATLNVDALKKKATDAKIDAKTLTCSNCQFYTAGKDAKQGPCTLIAGKLVHGPGSCNTWVKRA